MCAAVLFGCADREDTEMATNLVPASSSFTTTNMKPDAGDDGDEVWGQQMAENSGFNFLGTTNKPYVAWGTKTVNYDYAFDTTTTVTISTDKTEGIANFPNAFVALVQPVNRPGGALPLVVDVSSVTPGASSSFVITVRNAAGAGTGSFTVNWFAFGY